LVQSIAMKKWICSAVLCCLCIYSRALPADTTLTAKVKEVVSHIQAQFAPDKRTAVFQVQLVSPEPLVLSVETTEPASLPAFKSVLAKALPAAQVQEQVLPAKDLGEKVYGIARLSVCNNRAQPANAAEMVTQTLMGTVVDILKKEKGYYLVRTPDGYISWTEASGISPVDKTGLQQWLKANRVVFTAEFGHAYSEPDERSLPVSDLVSGDILQLSGKKKGFARVLYPDGRVAYIEKKWLTPYSKWVAGPNPTATQILTTAQTLMGVPYLWGGTSIKGVDCSGFTKTCYFLNGVIIPRDASQQALVGEAVDIYEQDSVSLQKCLANLQAGDLLFFGWNPGGKGTRIVHTAIYMGKGAFIQSAGFVRISSLVPSAANYDEREAKRLVSARRMLTAIGTPGITRIDQHAMYN
jgi:hypothetical protein